MPERDRGHHPEQETPYWNADARIGTLRLGSQKTTPLHLQAHVSPEQPARLREDLVAIPRQEERGYIYVQGRPYIAEPDLRLTVALNPNATQDGPIGTVVGNERAGARQRVVRNAQAWCYPGERTIILWECYLFEQHRQADSPAEDANLLACWRGFERFLLRRFPETGRVVTTHDDPLYDTTEYQRFLGELGYRQYSPRAFEKEVRRAGLKQSRR